jgi:hypothetical protein
LDAGADFFPVFLWPSFQPAEDRHITARPQSNQDGIAPTCWDALDCDVEDILLEPLSASRLCEILRSRGNYGKRS